MTDPAPLVRGPFQSRKSLRRFAVGFLSLFIIGSAVFVSATIIPHMLSFLRSTEMVRWFGRTVYHLRNPDAAEARLEPMPATEIWLFDPTGLAEDGTGNLLIVDRGAWFGLGAIWRVGRDGIARIVAGSGIPPGPGPSAVVEMRRPQSLAVDQADRIYFADSANDVVMRIEHDGQLTRIAGSGGRGFAGDGGPAKEALLSLPQDVHLDPEGRIYIADFGNHCIRRVDLDHTIETVAGTGEPGYTGDGGPAVAAQLDGPYGIMLDNENRLLIADSHNHVIRRIDRDGTITTIAGSGSQGYSGDGGPALRASLDEPASLDVDARGRIYIGDEHNHAIRVIALDGTISTLIGNGSPGYSAEGALAAEVMLNDPEAVLVKEDGSLVISDGDNGRVLALQPDGRIHTLAGGR